jgi:hypothetical protein
MPTRPKKLGIMRLAWGYSPMVKTDNNSEKMATSNTNTNYYDVEKNHDLARKLFDAYYRAHSHSGALFDDFPEYFLIKPEILVGRNLATRASDKLILEDCITRAQARNGYIGVAKHRNPKLQYYWLELSIMPFVLGDPVNEDNSSEFFYLLSHFIEYARNNPKIYGDLTADLDSDKDLALMLKEINKQGNKLQPLLEKYSANMLLSFNPNWPVTEVKKLLMALKDNDQSWCEVFFEYLIYVMGKKTSP